MTELDWIRLHFSLDLSIKSIIPHVFKKRYNISLESDIKTIAEAIFEQFGLTKNEAIELFYYQVAMTKDIPFIQRSLNEETIKAIEEVKEKDSLKTYNNFAEIRQDIEV